MRLAVKHLSQHPKIGVLRFRRVFPPHLRPHIPGNRLQLTVTLNARTIEERGALDAFKAASARYDAMVAKAEKAAEHASKIANGGVRVITPELVAFLAEACEVEATQIDEEVRNLPEPSARKYARMANIRRDVEEDLTRARLERGAGDLDAMAATWGDDAIGFAISHDIAVSRDDPAFPELVRAFHDANIRAWRGSEP